MVDLSKIEFQLKKFFKEAQKLLAEHPFWQYTPQILMGAALITITTLMFPHQQTYQFANLKEKEISNEEIIAPFTFLINKSEEEYNNDKKAAAEKVPWVFNRVDSVGRDALQRLESFFRNGDAIRVSISPDSIKIRRLRELFNAQFIIMEQSNLPYLLAHENKSEPTNKRARSLRDAVQKPSGFSYETLKLNLRRTLVDIYAIGILDRRAGAIPEYVNKIAVITADNEIIEDLGNFYPLDSVERIILDEKLRHSYPDNETAVKIGYSIVTAFILPNLIYDAAATDKRIVEAVASVPLAKGTVIEKERIVDKHERITREILEKLNSLAQAKAERELQEGGIKLVLPYIGRVLVLSLALSFTVIFLMVSRWRSFRNVKKMVMLLLILMLILGFTFLINQLGFSTYKYLIPIAIAPMLLTIFFDSRTAFIGTVSLSFIIGALRGNEFGIVLISLFVGTIAILSVQKIHTRAWVLKGILMIAGAYVFSITTLEFLRNPDYFSWMDLVYGILNAILSPILAYGLMIIFEYLFQETTDSTLLELLDLNKPVMRQLAISAPGTYHHSVMVGILSEAAAEAIGANALLAKVGSYYHDIGKMEMPEYFVENQKGGKNPHEKLTPSMSCLILINHVKRGLEMAEDYNIPQEIRNFIAEHHGTNLIIFFYNKALESNDGTEINESDFRYPGPKPRAKETGIVMLADAVEAGSRTLKDPTVSRIRSLVSSLIQERITDGELDECPLTVRDLKIIQESFVNNLTGIYHGRIEYPNQQRRLFGKNVRKTAEKVSETHR
ncbi:MAG TPA: HDIG domain-containing protein [bacterium]